MYPHVNKTYGSRWAHNPWPIQGPHSTDTQCHVDIPEAVQTHTNQVPSYIDPQCRNLIHPLSNTDMQDAQKPSVVTYDPAHPLKYRQPVAHKTVQ